MIKRELIRNNIFPPSWNAVKEIEGFRWHDEAYKINSSQALAIDVFGYLQISPNRDIILDELSSKLGFPSESPGRIQLEWNDPLNLLNERKARTQVDVVIRNEQSLVFAECKFTEPNGAPCRQTQPFSHGPKKGLIQCNGRYQEQLNPYNDVTSKCALTGKNIRYWELIDEIFQDQIYEYDECPFAGPWYQWMRNITLCYEIAKTQGLFSTMLLVYADDSEFNMVHEIRSQKWSDFLSLIKPNTIGVKAVSYQQLLDTITDLNTSDQDIWLDLERWILSKMNMSSIIIKYRKKRANR
jgi:hypothetical protein